MVVGNKIVVAVETILAEQEVLLAALSVMRREVSSTTWRTRRPSAHD